MHNLSIHKQYDGIDLFKFLMSIIVVAIHTHPFEKFAIINNSKLYEIICSTATPYFFISFGFFMSIYKYDILDINSITRLYENFFRIAKMYTKWVIIYTPVAIWYFYHNGHNGIHNLLSYTKGYLFIGHQFYSWQLWYLLSTAYSVLMIIIFVKLNYNKKLLLTTSIGFFIFGVFIDNYNSLYFKEIEILQYFFQKMHIFFGSGRLFTGSFYILAGYYIHKNNFNPNLYASMITIAALIVIYINVPVIYHRYIVAIISIYIFSISYNFISSKKKFFYYLRKSSTIIYLTHMLFFFLYSLIFKELNYFGLDAFFVVIICTFLLSYILLANILYKNFIKWIF